MNTQIEQLKTELREFIELSNSITPSPWYQAGENVQSKFRGIAHNTLIFNATFIARSRNISPAMAECLLVAVENLELIHEQTDLGEYAAWDALQQILTIWEATK